MAAQLTTDQVAELVGLSPESLREYVRRGAFPAADGKLGRTPWWESTTVERWKATRRVPGRPSKPEWVQQQDPRSYVIHFGRGFWASVYEVKPKRCQWRVYRNDKDGDPQFDDGYEAALDAAQAAALTRLREEGFPVE